MVFGFEKQFQYLLRNLIHTLLALNNQHQFPLRYDNLLTALQTANFELNIFYIYILFNIF